MLADYIDVDIALSNIEDALIALKRVVRVVRDGNSIKFQLHSDVMEDTAQGEELRQLICFFFGTIDGGDLFYE